MTSTLAPPPARPPRAKEVQQRGLGSARGNIIAGIAAWAIGILFVFPVFFMVLTSLHSEVNASTNPPSFFALLSRVTRSSSVQPREPALAPVDQLSDRIDRLNDPGDLAGDPAAYALAVKPIKKWTDAMFFFLSTKMLPAVAGLLPLYIFARYLGLLDNINYLLILYTAMNLPIAGG